MPDLPSRCAVCHAWPAQPVCEDCVRRFAQPRTRCRSCALPVHGGAAQCGACLLAPPPLDACVAAVSYAYPWSGLITRWKFQDQPALARSLALLLRSAPWVEPALEQAALLLPMPLADARLRQRGFNQALELARCICPDKTDARVLLRIKDTPAQPGLNRQQRMTNLQGAFALDRAQAFKVQGRHIVLLDDVMTTGASLHGAARCLRAAGARHITGMVVARTD